MVSKNNKRLLEQSAYKKNNRYSIRRLKVGVASVAVATGLIFASQATLEKVAAETVPVDSRVELQNVEEVVAVEESEVVVEDQVTLPEEESFLSDGMKTFAPGAGECFPRMRG